MTASVSQHLPAAASARPAHSAKTGDDGAAFGAVLNDIEKTSRTAPSATNAAGRHPLATEPAVADADGDPGTRDEDDGKTRRSEGDEPPDGAPLQAAMPLLMTLHDLGRIAPKGDRSAGAQDSASLDGDRPAVDGNRLVPTARDGKPPSDDRAGTPANGQIVTKAVDAGVSVAGDPTAPAQKSERRSAVDRKDPSAGGTARSDSVFASQAAPAGGTRTSVAEIASALRGDAPDPSVQPGRSADQAMEATKDAGTGSATRNFEDRRGPVSERVTVVADHSFPAPASHPAGQTASGLVSAIASDDGWRQALSAPAVPLAAAHNVAAPTHVLKIELHPAELGAVNVSMRLAGGQLSIEITPESREAYRRLSVDTETITKSLRDLGFDIGKVTVMQPSLAAAPAARSDMGSSAAGSTGRDQQSFQSGGSGQSGNSGGSGNGSGGQQSGRGGSNDGQNPGRMASPVRGRAGGGLFI